MSEAKQAWKQLEAIRNSPDFQRYYRRIQRREHLARTLTAWMRDIPIVGELVSAFWYGLVAEGLRNTCKPRWGLITFAFLNDGMKPTWWHTWYQVTHKDAVGDPFVAIYPGGAPKSLAQAKAWEERR